MVRTWTMALLAIGGLAGLNSLPSQVQAEEAEAIIRICDRVPGEATGGQAGGGSCPQGAGQGVAGCPTCRSGAGCPSHGGYGYGGYGCNYGYCGLGIIRPGGHVHQALDWFNPHGMCTHSPDHGWAPPGKMHTPHPQMVAYRKSFPDSWTGQPGAGVAGGQRPVQIYMPTDTTQLGYYYQAVPRWHATRGMVPGVPDPRQWHRDMCQGKGTAGCKTCQNGQAAVNQGEQIVGEQIINEKVIEGPVNNAPPQQVDPQPQLVDPQPQPVEPQPQVAPPPPAAAPPAAPLEKAETPNLQRIN